MPPTTFLSPESLANLSLILISVVPGLIIAWIRSQFVLGRITSRSAALTYYVAVSFVYNAFTYPFIFDSINENEFNMCVWFFYIIILPALIGFLLGLEAQNQCIYGFLNKIHWRKKYLFNLIHPIETAWDWKFKQETYEFIIITLKDGTYFGAKYVKGSFASSDPSERDLYLAKIYDIDNEGNWTLKDNTGVLVPAGEIKKIDFILSPPKGDSRNE